MVNIKDAYDIYADKKGDGINRIIETETHYVFDDGSRTFAPQLSVNKETGEAAYLNPIQLGLTSAVLRESRIYEGTELDEILSEY